MTFRPFAVSENIEIQENLHYGGKNGNNRRNTKIKEEAKGDR